MSNQNTNLPAQRPPSQMAVVRGWVEGMAPEIEKVLSKIPRDYFVRIVFNALQTNPKLLDCNRSSLLNAVMRSAVVNLEPDGTHAALVPYGTECTFIPMYRGLIRKALEAGDVADIQSFVICENDTFRHVLGTEPKIEHLPAPFGQRGEIVGFYAVAWFKDGRHPKFEVMEKAEVDAIRARSRAKNGPWATDYVEMGRKTPVRRLCKYLKLDAETQRLITDDERMDSAADAEVIDDGSARPSTVEGLKNRLKESLTPGLRQSAPAAREQDVPQQSHDEHIEQDAGGGEEWHGQEPDEDPFAEPEPPKPTVHFPGEPKDWYEPTQGGIDLSLNPKSELELPATPVADWLNKNVWSASMLKEWTPRELLYGGRNGKRHAALRGSIDYVKKRQTRPPEQALIAAWCLGHMQARWDKMEAAGLDPKRSAKAP